MRPKRERSDVLVVGAGVAGLSAALAAADAGGSVLVVAKASHRSSNSYAAQGGIAAAVGVRCFMLDWELLRARNRLRSKLSYTNLGFALAPPSFTLAELRDLYAAALGHPVGATNLQRVLLRRELLEDTGEYRRYGSGGGRPATIYRFRSDRLEITDQFAVLRPPTLSH